MSKEVEVKNIIVAISGCRQYDDQEKFFAQMDKILAKLELNGFGITKWIIGDASGIDALAEDWCIDRNQPFHMEFADWDKLGKGAGFARNTKMIDPATHLIAFWDGETKGTKHALDYAMSAHKTTFRITIATTKRRYYSKRQKAEFEKRRNEDGQS